MLLSLGERQNGTLTGYLLNMEKLKAQSYGSVFLKIVLTFPAPRPVREGTFPGETVLTLTGY